MNTRVTPAPHAAAEPRVVTTMPHATVQPQEAPNSLVVHTLTGEELSAAGLNARSRFTGGRVFAALMRTILRTEEQLTGTEPEAGEEPVIELEEVRIGPKRERQEPPSAKAPGAAPAAPEQPAGAPPAAERPERERPGRRGAVPSAGADARLARAPRAAPAPAAPAPRPGAARRAGPGRAPGPMSDLDAWRSAMSSATNEIAPAELGEAVSAPGKLADKANATEQQRAAERRDYHQEARGQLPPEPKGPPPEDQLDTKLAEAALGAVTTAGRGRLRDQTFPAMKPLPSGLVRKLPQPVVPPAPPAPPPAPAPAKAPADPRKKALASKLAQVKPVPPPAGTAGAATVSDSGAAKLAPLPAKQATMIADVAARILMKAPLYAQQTVGEAGAPLDPRKLVHNFVAILNNRLATEQVGLTTELEGVAGAAGVAKDALYAKVAAQQAAAAKQEADATGQLDQQAVLEKAKVDQRGKDEHAAIKGAASATHDEALHKQEAVRGGADPAVVNARRDDFLKKVYETVGAGSAAFRAAKEKRAADLLQIANNQKAAYRRQATEEAARINGPAVPGQDQTAARIAAQPLMAWVENEFLTIDAELARLNRETQADVGRLQEALDIAADDARDRIRDWAAERLGHERSWWERLWDLFTDWIAEGEATTAAWEAQRNAETRDKVASDLSMLVKLRDDMAAGNREALMAELNRMSKEEQAVAVAFLTSAGKDALGAVAAGMLMRIKAHRVPELAKEVEEEAIKSLGWEDLNKLGANQTPDFDAGKIVFEIRGAVEGIGTNEKRLFAALSSRTRLQIEAMRKAYAHFFHGRDMDDDIDSDVTGSEQDRADALRSGDPTAAAVATLRDAMDGAGTDEALIMQTLRGKTPAEIDAIKLAYKERYGAELRADFDDEMGGHEFAQADALLAHDLPRADAEALKDAMQGAGTDEAAMNAVYSQIRAEVEAQAQAKGWTTAQVEAEVKRRNDEVKRSYAEAFAGGDPGALEADFRDELSGGELNLTLAAADANQTAMDAAKLEIEHESLWTSDDKVNEILRNQQERARREVMRDLNVDFSQKAATMTPEQREAARAEMLKRADGLIEARAKQNMAALQATYNADYGSSNAFDFLIAFEVSGYSQEEALKRIKSGGKLSDAEELKYAIFGLGTNEQVIRDTLKDKSLEEIKVIKDQYRLITGNELKDDLEGDLSGRDEADMTLLLETGDGTPAEKMAYLEARKDWELTSGTGTEGGQYVQEETEVLKATTAEAREAYEEYEQILKNPTATPEDKEEALARFKRFVGYGDKAIDHRREELDSVTDTLATVGAVAAGIVVSIITAGAGAPLVLAAVLGAVAGTAASMTVKQRMKGGAYGGEDIAIDIAQGTADAILAAFTAGRGAQAIAWLAKSPAFAGLARLAEGGVISRMGGKALEGGIEGMIQGLPSGMVAAILNEETWRSPNPLLVILESGRKGSLQGLGMGAVMGAGFEGVMGHGPAARPEVAGEAHVPAASEAHVPAPVEPAPEVRVEPEAAPTPQEPPTRAAPGEKAPPEAGAPKPTPTDEIPLIDLPEGSVMFGSEEAPLSHADAQRMYENARAETPDREAMILENVDTGERIVIQGGETAVGAAKDVWTEFLAQNPKGRWKPVRHSHPVKGGVTEPHGRLPSGRGDIGGAERIARSTGKPARETLDIVTEAGAQEVHYGYDPGAEKPYWVDAPRPDGTRVKERFRTLGEYDHFYARETGNTIQTAPTQPEMPAVKPGEPDRSTAITEPEMPAVRRVTEAAPPEAPPAAPKKEPTVVEEIERVRAEKAGIEKEVKSAQAAVEAAEGTTESARVDLHDAINAYAERVPKDEWLSKLDARKPGDRELLRDFLARKPDVAGGEGTLADVRRKLRTFERAEAAAPDRIAQAKRALAATETSLAKKGEELTHWEKQVRIVADDVPLSPRLPDPDAGLLYKPAELVKGKSQAQRDAHINGYKTEVRLANHVADNLGEAVVKYADVSGRNYADVVSVDPEGSVTLWDSKYRSSGAAHPGSETFAVEPDPLSPEVLKPGETFSDAIADAADSLGRPAAGDYTAEMQAKAQANLAKGNFTAYTVSADEGGFHSCRKLVFKEGVLVLDENLPFPFPK